ncbi:hypothetical protein D3Z38_05635 [Clostridiales bacterium]|jgi:hypothetical protein|nr:hypothetical protein [Clostridiales bacterium]
MTIIGTEKRFKHTCGELFQDSGNIVFIEKLEDPYGFMRKDLYFFCNNGYGWYIFLTNDRVRMLW